MSGAPRLLLEILERSRQLGFLGPGPVESHLGHALGLARAAEPVPRRFLDLGSGGGVPGLVVALEWPASGGALLDSQERRCQFLRDAVVELGLDDRVEVVEGRAEDLARREDLRGSFDLVLARSFAAPAVTAECAAGFLEVGGRLIVSEPPQGESGNRWPEAGLQTLGFAPVRIESTTGATAAITALREQDDRWPRRTGVPAKRPLWKVG